MSGTQSGRRASLTRSAATRATIVTVVVVGALGATPVAEAAGPPPSPAGSAEAPASARPGAGKVAILWPTAVRGVERMPPAEAALLASSARALDALLADSAQDLGLSLALSERAAGDAAPLAEADLHAEARASGGYAIAASLEPEGAELALRLVLADASSPALRMRVERVTPAKAPVRAVVMLRDLLSEPTAGEPKQPAPPLDAARGEVVTPARSAGRATLVVNATLYGGLFGYSVQRSTGSDDPRLLYPLLAVGAGVGLGGSLIIAEEWDVGVGDAWFLAAGAWWPTLAGHLLYEGRFAPYDTGDETERWAFGIVGGTTGIALSTLGLTLRGMSDGGALLAHSGGGLGLVLGGLGDIAIRGDVEVTPSAGMGYGAGLGWLVASAVATQVHVSPSRVLALDLGALLGGLGGAALASPLLFDAPTPTAQRAWVGVTAGSVLAGAGVAWYLTRPRGVPRTAPAPTDPRRFGRPTVGVVGESIAPGRRAPVYGVAWNGTLD